MRNESLRTATTIGIAAAIAHLLLLSATVAQILSAHAGEWQQYWIKFLALDFPLSLGVMPVAWLLPPAAGGPLHDFANFWWPLAYHAFIGTFWWYVLGNFMLRKVRTKQRAGERNDDAGP
jgi:hypothetical protein